MSETTASRQERSRKITLGSAKILSEIWRCAIKNLKHNLFEYVQENVRHFSFMGHDGVTAPRLHVISSRVRETPQIMLTI